MRISRNINLILALSILCLNISCAGSVKSAKDPSSPRAYSQVNVEEKEILADVGIQAPCGGSWERTSAFVE